MLTSSSIFCSKTCGVEERNKLCEELHGMLKGTTGDKNRYSRLVLAHDMTRVVQVMLKYSNTKIKNEIMQVNLVIHLSNELLGKYNLNFIIPGSSQFCCSDVAVKLWSFLCKKNV